MWLNENEQVSMDFAQGAYERDRKEQFPQNSDQTLFSYSVVDIFTQLNQSLEIVKKMECSDDSFNENIIHNFSQTVSKVLTQYSDSIQKDFHNYIENEKLACILMNNIQHVRIQLENLYQIMGGDQQFDDRVQNVLCDLQLKLNNVLEQLVESFELSLEREIVESTQKLRDILLQVKDNNQTQRVPSVEEIHTITEPLKNLLLQFLCGYISQCENTVRKLFIKKLWKTTVSALKQILLPSSCDNDSESSLMWEGTLTFFQDLTRKSNKQHLYAIQCTTLDAVLESIKMCFMNENVVKSSLLEHSSDYQSLKYALSLYTQTTNQLIKTFISNQTRQNILAEEHHFGQLSVEVDIFTHPGTGEHKVTTNIIVADGLQWQSTGVFRPFVELHILGPHLLSKTRTFATKTKSNNWSPKFNESFVFVISNEEDPEYYELMFFVKDYCFARQDRIVGVGILQLKNIVQQTSCACWIQLARRLKFDDAGLIVLQILSQRQQDEIANEFVKLKSECRYESCVANNVTL